MKRKSFLMWGTLLVAIMLVMVGCVEENDGDVDGDNGEEDIINEDVNDEENDSVDEDGDGEKEDEGDLGDV